MSRASRWDAALGAVRERMTPSPSNAPLHCEEEPASPPQEVEERRRRAWMHALKKHPSLALVVDNPLMANMVLDGITDGVEV